MTPSSESDRYHLTNFVALYQALNDKGLLSAEEIRMYRARASALVDQELARERDELVKEFRREFGELAEAVESLMRILGRDA